MRAAHTRALPTCAKRDSQSAEELVDGSSNVVQGHQQQDVADAVEQCQRGKHGQVAVQSRGVGRLGCRQGFRVWHVVV